MLVSLPIVAVAVFAGLTGVLILVAHSQHSQRPSTAGGVAFIAWGLAGLACGAVCVLASRRALFAMPVARGWLLAAFACGALVTAAMVAMTIATAIYTIALSVDASALAGEPNGPRLPGSSWNFDGDPTGIVMVRR
jgi:peptidoglycan/LPS O-acetylase OafA/YrhL